LNFQQTGHTAALNVLLSGLQLLEDNRPAKKPRLNFIDDQLYANKVEVTNCPKPEFNSIYKRNRVLMNLTV
jgi:hypothetical protein